MPGMAAGTCVAEVFPRFGELTDVRIEPVETAQIFKWRGGSPTQPRRDRPDEA